MNTASESGSLNKKVKIGLLLAIFLGVLDIAGLALPGPDGETPPIAVMVIACILGIATIVFAVIALKNRNRNAVRGVVITRFLSALASIPAFFVSGIPGPVIVLTAVLIVLTVVAIALMMSKPFLVEHAEATRSAQTA
ncbi:hypothetical protein [Nocardia sp. 348MFTsu5.1]|uniref:hypothetical protein n=1 Tax=Nocardia sp. 348MFTsu5.1 TaxID=1172185 RepID=UPI0003A66A65|nr:hypothetical protein [Nocardia sp. 348MFTsu5.1]